MFFMKTLQLYSLRTFRTHTIRIRNGHKHKKYVQRIRRECSYWTLREHVYILLKNDHWKHSANVPCMFFMETLQLYSLRTFRTHTIRIRNGHKHKKYVQSIRRECFNGTLREHVHILLRNDHWKHSVSVPGMFFMKTYKIYSLRTFWTHNIRIINGQKHKKYVKSMRRECSYWTLREHVYIPLRNDHSKHSANVPCIFLRTTFKIHSLGTFLKHTIRIKQDISMKKYV